MLYCFKAGANVTVQSKVTNFLLYANALVEPGDGEDCCWLNGGGGGEGGLPLPNFRPTPLIVGFGVDDIVDVELF